MQFLASFLRKIPWSVQLLVALMPWLLLFGQNRSSSRVGLLSAGVAQSFGVALLGAFVRAGLALRLGCSEFRALRFAFGVSFGGFHLLGIYLSINQTEVGQKAIGSCPGNVAVVFGDRECGVDGQLGDEHPHESEC